MIYLDNAATTRVSLKAFCAALPYMLYNYGNPSSIHKKGRIAKKAIEKSRKQIADAIGTTPEHIIFTSGGSEANTLALYNAAQYLKKTGKKHIITTKAEHSSVKNNIKSWFYNDFDITYLQLNSSGSIDISDLLRSIREDTGLVVIMSLNNETGAKFDYKKIGRICSERGIIFHTDCVQGFDSMGIQNIDNSGISSMSVSGHKLHALKGVGFLYVNHEGITHPLIIGGSQEAGFRAGTENVASIVSLGIAVKDAMKKHLELEKHYVNIYRSFTTELCGNVYFNSIVNHINLEVPGKIISVRFDEIDAETLVLELSNKGILVSAGSACNANSNTPSESLLALGLTPKQAKNSIRISFSRYTTKHQAKRAALIIAKTVYDLQNDDYYYTSTYCNW